MTLPPILLKKTLIPHSSIYLSAHIRQGFIVVSVIHQILLACPAHCQDLRCVRSIRGLRRFCGFCRLRFVRVERQAIFDVVQAGLFADVFNLRSLVGVAGASVLCFDTGGRPRHGFDGFVHSIVQRSGFWTLCYSWLIVFFAQMLFLWFFESCFGFGILSV